MDSIKSLEKTLTTSSWICKMQTSSGEPWHSKSCSWSAQCFRSYLMKRGGIWGKGHLNWRLSQGRQYCSKIKRWNTHMQSYQASSGKAMETIRSREESATCLLLGVLCRETIRDAYSGHSPIANYWLLKSKSLEKWYPGIAHSNREYINWRLFVQSRRIPATSCTLSLKRS